MAAYGLPHVSLSIFGVRLGLTNYSRGIASAKLRKPPGKPEAFRKECGEAAVYNQIPNDPSKILCACNCV